MHICPESTGLVPHVGGPILPTGCPTVLIGGLPVARMGDQTAHGGVIVFGLPTVLIGDAGDGGDGGAAGGGAGVPPATPAPCLRAASAAGSPFVRS